MIRIYDQNDVVTEYGSYFNFITDQTSPFKEMIFKSDFSSYGFAFEANESKTLFSTTFLLQVNVKNSSSFFFVFSKQDFKREEILEKVSTLKDKEVVDVRSAKDKTFQLLDIIKDYHPLLIIYIQRKGFALYENELRYLLYDARLEYNHTFFIEKTGDELIDATTVIKEEVELKEPDTKKKKPVKEDKPKKEHKIKLNFKSEKANEIKNKLVDFFSHIPAAIRENKYHFMFLIISSFLIGFSGAVGIFNSIVGKTIAVLFFICAIVGSALNTFIYVDFFKNDKIKSKNFAYSILSNFIGEMLSIVGFVIFYAVDTSENKKLANEGLLIFLSIAVLAVMVALTITIAYFIDKSKKKKLE